METLILVPSENSLAITKKVPKTNSAGTTNAKRSNENPKLPIRIIDAISSHKTPKSPTLNIINVIRLGINCLNANTVSEMNITEKQIELKNIHTV